MRDTVARVRQLLAETELPRASDTPEVQARRAFEYYEFNTAPPQCLEQTPAARAIRDIGRVVSWYGWRGEVDRALDAAGVGALQDLAAAQLLALQARMLKLEQGAQDGCDPPDCLPAR